MNRTILAATAFCALSLAPHAASACGGFFCSTSPIDQAGETVVYGLEDDGTLTMSVRVQYTGDDDDFAWILPVMAPPEISIGSDALFDELRRVTEPTFITEDVTRGTCRPHPRCVSERTCAPVSDYSGGGCGFSAGAAEDPWTGDFVDAAAVPVDAGAAWDAAASPPDPGVMVFSEGPIGPYDTVVLGATTAREVVDWLREHDYQVPEASLPLLETYAAAGQVFVALRLRSNVETRVIRPIVLRMPTTEACLPIRLTSIATVPNLPVTTFFLGSAPVASSNYSEAFVETADVRFAMGTRRWPTAVAEAVEEMGGHAFVRDYGGPTPAIPLAVEGVEDLATSTDAGAFLRALDERGYRGDPTLLELLEAHVPVPEEYEGAAQAYYNCLFLGGCAPPESFDAAGLSARITAEITAPRQAAHELVHRHRYLTRLSTRIAAEDMDIDPVFVEDEGIPDVDNVHTVSRVTECSRDHYEEDAPMYWEIGGEEIIIRSGRVSSDSAYCRRLGGVLESERTECDPPAESSSSSGGGCLCMVGGAAPIQGGIVFGLGLILAARRLRRRRR